MTNTLLFSPEALRNADAVLVDVRPAPAAFLPGALHAPLCPSFVDPGEPGRGRNPWKDVRDVRNFLASIGVTPDDTVVFYDDGGMGSAARAWYASLGFRNRERAFDVPRRDPRAPRRKAFRRLHF